MDQQDLFFASYLSNQRANQVAGQMERSQLIAALVSQGKSLQAATWEVDRHLAAHRRGSGGGIGGLVFLFIVVPLLGAAFAGIMAVVHFFMR